MDRARRHETRLLLASRPALYALLSVGMRLPGGIRRVPRLGWVVTDPVLARAVLNDPRHFTLLGEGGVGHLWAQVLGDWVYDVFDGPGHADLRSRSRELFTDASSQELVRRVMGPTVGSAMAELRAGATVDIARLARVLVGQMVADLLGLGPVSANTALEVFAAGERLAGLALRSAASTELPPSVIAAARPIISALTVAVPRTFRSAPADTLLGRCRELGLSLQEASGLATLMMVAGTETAASAMGRIVALLHDTGQQRALFDDPALIGSAVWDGLRVTTPAPVIGRHVHAAVTVGGRRLAAGDRILLLTYVANNRLGAFDVNRRYVPELRQLWFGAGRHLCLGAALARAEIGFLLQSLVDTGRPWRVEARRYGSRVLIPSYSALRVRLSEGAV
jgi:cytochrome P450